MFVRVECLALRVTVRRLVAGIVDTDRRTELAASPQLRAGIEQYFRHRKAAFEGQLVTTF